MADWQEKFSHKMTTADIAISKLRNGQCIFIGSACSEPQKLTSSLATLGNRFVDVEVIHLMSRSRICLTSPQLAGHFRYNTFYVGKAVSDAITGGDADFTPVSLHELPGMIASGRILIDVALIQVSPPDDLGFCSLGISVDAVRAAAENAGLVIAQVNPRMPRVLGNSFIRVEDIDFLVEGDEPLITVESPVLDAISLTIGKFVADLIEDGSCLHLGSGAIPCAVTRHLEMKHDLGIHTMVITDDILRLIYSGAVSNMKKNTDRGKSVGAMAVGSEKLYDALNVTPHIELHPLNHVSDPAIISKNDNFVSVNSVLEIDLSGLGLGDALLVGQDDSGIGSNLDFVYGAHESQGGKAILALPSTSSDGSRSRIVPKITESSGLHIDRAAVDFVVTEYGSVQLTGLSLRERAIALISIAHPRFRQTLLEAAKKLRYVPSDQRINPEGGEVYPTEYEVQYTCKDGLKVKFRPIKPFDERRLKRMFYSQSPETLYARFHTTVKAIPEGTIQNLVNIDYSKDVCILGLVGPEENPRIVGMASYMYHPPSNMGEFDMVVAEDFRGRGIGSFLSHYITEIARSRGLSGMWADVLVSNEAAKTLFERMWPRAARKREGGVETFTYRFEDDDKPLHPLKSAFVYSERFSDFEYSPDHPFKPSRAKDSYRLCLRQGFLKEPWMRVVEPKPMAEERLVESHDPGYLDALKKAGQGKFDESFLGYGLGTDDCPIFKGLWDYILLYCSSTLAAVDLLLENRYELVFCPLGGFHHSGREHAEGFCYVNDVIVAIDYLLAHGLRVAFVDIDAHHCNGVQDAYYEDDRVLVISLHESGKTLYPWSGFETEIGKDKGKGYNMNIPLPRETDDECYLKAFTALVPPALSAFAPDVLIGEIGADTHRNDPLTNLKLTNNGYAGCIEILRDISPRILLLGGGGYDPDTTARSWARAWAMANNIEQTPGYMANLGGTFLGSLELDDGSLEDMRYYTTGKIKEDIILEIDRIIQFHKENILKLLMPASR
ncbi:MAG: GNAT family N-acetyltransferase [Deltaproteobacteria bacterium]|nr:GNAT family N-acetyltransferase [Deltaproteobacteria bacterium]